MNAQELSDQLAAVVAAADASVVRVEGPRQVGSGLVWDGVIVTAWHLAAFDEGISVGLPDGRRVPATVVGRDRATDLAVLKVDAPLTSAVRAEEASLKAGNLTLLLGRPGRRVRASLGVVGEVGGPWKSRLGGEIDAWIDVDGSLPAGFSGGPLINLAGQVVGLNTHGLTRGGTTIPITTVSRVVSRILSKGGLRRAYLGVGVQPVKLAERAGLLVVGLDQGGPAEQAGLVVGDVLLTAGDTSLNGVRDLLGALHEGTANQPITLSLLRGGEPKTLTVALGERPATGC